MTLTVRPKTSNIVKYQLPEAIRNNNELFVEFLTEYYKFMEQEDNPDHFIRNIQDSYDVDRTQYFLEQLKKHVLPYSLENADTIIKDEYLIKFLRELYLSKGTNKSFKYIFEKLYNAESELDYGRNYVFKLSDNEYLNQSYMIIMKRGGYLLNSINGKEIYQHLARATIQDISLYEHEQIRISITASINIDSDILYNISNISDLYVGDIVCCARNNLPKNTQIIEKYDTYVRLSANATGTITNSSLNIKDAYYKCILDSTDIIGIFNEKETIKYLTDSVENEANLVSIITHVDVNIPGSLYIPGQNLNILGGSGSQLRVTVGEVSAGSVEDIIIHDPGTGYTVGDIIGFNDPTNRGKGAEAIVTAIDGYGAELIPVYSIHSLAVKNSGKYYAVNDIIGTDLVKTDGTPVYITVTAVDNTNKVMDIASKGYDYHYARAIFKQGGSFIYTEPTIVQGSISNVDVPAGSLDVYAHNGLINGSGCYGTVTVTSGSSVFTITDFGRNYVAPVVKIISGVDILEIPTTTIVMNTEYGITSIISVYSSLLANGIYDFEVTEQYGYGFSGSLVDEGKITTVSIPTDLMYDIKHIVNHYSGALESTGGTDAEFFVYYQFDDVLISSGGKQYTYPTINLTESIGYGFSGQLIVDGGSITGVNIINSGNYYPHNTTVTLGAPGSSAVISPVINNNGSITSFTISNAGTGYTVDSAITLVTGQVESSITLTQTSGVITATTVSNPGVKLFKQPILSIEDSYDAVSNIVCTTVAESNTITTTGNAFLNIAPGDKFYHEDSTYGINGLTVITIIDGNTIELDTVVPISISTSFKFIKKQGRISALKLLSGGSGYQLLPDVITPTKSVDNDVGISGSPVLWNNREQAKLIPLSNSIGKILSCSIDNAGINYEETPILSTPITGIMRTYSSSFIRNELMIDSNWVYTDTVNYSDGPRARLKKTDLSKNLIFLNEATDDFYFYTEDGRKIITEDNKDIIHEYSFNIDVNTTLKGTESGSTMTFYIINRGSVLASSNIILNIKDQFISNNGFTSYPHIKLHDGKRVQDYSYYIKTFDKLINNMKYILGISEYKNTVSEMVHPAGYKMYGEIQLNTNLSLPLSLYRILDDNGNEVNPTIILSILLGNNVRNKFTPRDLERIKFTIMPHTDMMEDVDHLSLYSLNEFYGPTAVAHDILYTGSNSGYWSSYSNTNIGTFSDVTFDQIINNEWTKSSHYSYIPDSYTTIITT